MIPEVIEEINGKTYRFRLSARAALDIKHMISAGVEKKYDLDEVYDDPEVAKRMDAKISRAIIRVTKNSAEVMIKIIIRHDDLSKLDDDEAELVLESLGIDDITRILDTVMDSQGPKRTGKTSPEEGEPAKN